MPAIRFLTAWRRRTKGEVVEIDEFVAATLVDHGIAERVDPASPEATADEVECMAVAAPEKAVLKRPKARRKRKKRTT